MREDELVVIALGLFTTIFFFVFSLMTKYFEPSTYIQWFDFKQKKKVFYDNINQEIQILPWWYIRVEPKQLQKVLNRIFTILMALSLIVSILYVFIL